MGKVKIRFKDIESSAVVQFIQRVTKTRGQRIFVIKSLFIFMVVVLTGVLVVMTLKSSKDYRMNLTFPDLEQSEEVEPKMIRPRFSGVDDNNQPYNITADTAIQEDKERVRVAGLQADITLSSGEWVSVMSDEGIIEFDKEVIDMVGNVNVFSDSGYEMRTHTAQVDFGTSAAFGTDPVEVQSPMGLLTAEGFMLEGDGQTIEFFGRVKLLLYPK